METEYKQKHFKFGDKVINHCVSKYNPHKEGIIVYCNLLEIKCTNGEGEFWEFSNDPDLQLEKIGSILTRIKPKVMELLQEARDLLVLCTLIDKSGQSKEMVEKIDNYFKNRQV